MLAARLHGPRDVRVEEVAVPDKGEVLVRITAAGVCHSDVHLWEGFFDMGGGNKYSTAKTMNPPRTMGHEIVGEVAALGPDAKGARVAKVDPFLPRIWRMARMGVGSNQIRLISEIRG